MSLEGRVALVTGGGRGVGKAISLGLAADGATVAVNYRRDEKAAAATVAEIEQAGGSAQAYAASVDDFEQDAEMISQIEADHGPIGILVNNAGIASRGQSVVDTETRDQAARAFEKNKNHHAVVRDKTGQFVGLISSWDIAIECVKDDRAWPWSRTSVDAAGKIQHPTANVH